MRSWLTLMTFYYLETRQTQARARAAACGCRKEMEQRRESAKEKHPVFNERIFLDVMCIFNFHCRRCQRFRLVPTAKRFLSLTSKRADGQANKAKFFYINCNVNVPESLTEPTPDVSASILLALLDHWNCSFQHSSTLIRDHCDLLNPPTFSIICFYLVATKQLGEFLF